MNFAAPLVRLHLSHCSPGHGKVDTGMIHKVCLQEKAAFLNKKGIIETIQSSGLLTLNEATVCLATMRLVGKLTE